MACFYTGFNYFARKNGIFKLGETGKDTPAQRLSTIRQKEHFQCLGYIVMPKATKSERLAVEAHARLKMSYLLSKPKKWRLWLLATQSKRVRCTTFRGLLVISSISGVNPR